MKQEEPNPYAPPAPIVERELASSVEEAIGALETFEFSGRLTNRELDEYLRADGHVGLARLTLLGLGIGTFLSALPMLGIAYFAVAFGAMGIVCIILMVSTLPYRRTMFVNANPNWSDPITGQIGANGIRIKRNDTASYHQWNWFGEAIADERLVALVPATQSAVPLLISREMFSSTEGWDALRRVANAIEVPNDDVEIEDARRDQNSRVLRDAKRGWSISPPNESILFEGAVWSDDYERVPGRHRNRQRPMRTHLVIYGLLGFAGIVLGGCSGLIFRHFAILPVIFAFYLVATIAIGRRRRPKSRSMLYYLRGYAEQSGIVTDFGLSVGETNWNAFQLVDKKDSSIVLRRRIMGNFVVLRADMFVDDASWHRFGDLVTDQLKSVSSRN